MAERRRALLLLLLCLCALLCSSCWNRRDPEQLAIVLGMAFDYEPEDELYTVWVQIVDPQATGVMPGEGGGGDQPPFLVVTASGQTPFEALRRLEEYTTREVFLAHNRVLLLSQALAEHGIAPVLDLFERERQLRTIVHPFIVQGDLSAIIAGDYVPEEIGAEGMHHQALSTRLMRAVLPGDMLLNPVYNTLAQPGRELILSRIQVIDEDEQEDEQEDGENGDEDGDGEAEVEQQLPGTAIGGAVFRGDRLAGWIEGTEAKGWGYVAGIARRSTFTIAAPDDGGSLVSIETYRTSGSLTLQAGSDSRIQMQVEVRADGRVQELHGHGAGGAPLDKESAYIRSLERRAAETMRAKVQAAIDSSQALGADFFGFGNHIYHHHPRVWDAIGKEWGVIFPQLDVEIVVIVNLTRAGLSTRPMEY